MTMEFLEGGAIKQLKVHLKRYYDDHDNEQLRGNVDKQVTSLIDLADKNRKAEDLLNPSNFPGDKNEEEKIGMSDAESDSKYGHLGWLN